jgi:hypothetical protein
MVENRAATEPDVILVGAGIMSSTLGCTSPLCPSQVPRWLIARIGRTRGSELRVENASTGLSRCGETRVLTAQVPCSYVGRRAGRAQLRGGIVATPDVVKLMCHRNRETRYASVSSGFEAPNKKWRKSSARSRTCPAKLNHTLASGVSGMNFSRSQKSPVAFRSKPLSPDQSSSNRRS